MTKSQVAKSQSNPNPNDQAPKPEEELISSRFPSDCGIWSLGFGVWDLTGIWFPGHWGLVKSVSLPELSRTPFVWPATWPLDTDGLPGKILRNRLPGCRFMGLLRAALAMAVVLGHTLSGRHRLMMIDPAAAVELFFIISGFYMGLILSEKYVGPKSFKLFITNRLLRLFPAYLLVLVISVLLWLLLGKRAGTDGPAGLFRLGLKPSALILLAGVQLLIVGQEIFLFARVGPGGSLIPTAHFQNHPPIWQYAVVPPAWSLSLELYFYAIAPFLIRLRTRTLVIVACCSFGCRLYIYEWLRLRDDPWTYRFFPSELMFFTAGILAYRAYAVIRAKPPSRFVLWAVTCCVLLLAILYQSLPGSRVIAGFEPRQWVCYAVTWAAMPLLFLWSNPVSGNNRWLRTIDRWIGEMSYPIYITHFFILQMLTLPTHRQLSLQFLLIAVVTITLVTSALLLKFVMQPIEHIRSKRARTVQSRALQYAVDVVTP